MQILEKNTSDDEIWKQHQPSMHFFAVLYISNGQKYIITLRGGVIFFCIPILLSGDFRYIYSIFVHGGLGGWTLNCICCSLNSRKIQKYTFWPCDVNIWV